MVVLRFMVGHVICPSFLSVSPSFSYFTALFLILFLKEVFLSAIASAINYTSYIFNNWLTWYYKIFSDKSSQC